MEATKAFKTFEDLEADQAPRALREAMHAVTRPLPNSEKFEVASQIRRAAVPPTNDIAEGHGRYHYLEQIKFTLYSRGSLEELINDLNVCIEEQYLPTNEVANLNEPGWRVDRLRNGYLRYLRERKAGAALELREYSPACGLTEDELDAASSDEPRCNDSTLQPFNQP